MENQKNKKLFNKLVRDKIPQIIENENRKPKFRVLDNLEFESALKNKLIEEANEVLSAKNKNEIIEELGDLFEVIETLMKLLNVEKKEIDVKRKNKNDVNGAFDNKLFLEYVE